MRRALLLALAAISLATGLFIFLAPMRFYEMIPGLSLMGPFSMHFVRDVALAFIASGAAMGWGAWMMNRPVAIAGVGWLFLHAIFHLQIWGVRGFPFDEIFVFDLVAVIAPAFLGAWAAATLIEDRAAA